MSWKPRIRLEVVTSDGQKSTAAIEDPHVTPTMIVAARELIYTLSTGRLCPRRPARKQPAKRARRQETR